MTTKQKPIKTGEAGLKKLKRINKVVIGLYSISENDPVFIIAEIGINHNGKLENAKRLIDGAVEAGANAVKFQMRDLKTLYGSSDLGENLTTEYTLDLLNRFELSKKDMFKVFDYCKKQGILPLCTPWDVASVGVLESYGMDAHKVASADLTNHELIRVLAKTGKPLIVSTGMSTEAEIVETVALLKKLGAKYVLLHCNSTYPAPFKDTNLRYMSRLQEIGDCVVGYSGHERGFVIPIAAVAMGAVVIEKHITLDRNMEGNDHKVSLLPEEFKQMVTAIRQVAEALGTDAPRKITQGERMNRVNLAKSLVAKSYIKAGKKISANVIEVKSPGRGLQPNRINDLIGSVAKQNFKKGDFFFGSDLVSKTISPRKYKFGRSWGLPVRYHDFADLTKNTNADFVEFHLSYKDLDLKVLQYFSGKHDLGLVVHSPDLFSGDHLLDLAAEDEKYRNQSILHLQRVINITRKLKKYFRDTEKVIIVASLGGFTRDGFCDPAEKAKMYARVADSLAKIDQTGVEVIVQTLPPFPWYFGGQLYCNLFVDPKETAEFCARYKKRICFDTSHSKLACNQFGWSMDEFINSVGRYIAHLHISDASGVDGEGLQVGEGEIDFKVLAKQLKKVSPNVGFIPEIWQGHENNGEGFWVALERLEKWF